MSGGPGQVSRGVRQDSLKEAASIRRPDSEEGTRKVKLKEAAKLTAAAAAAKKTETIREWDRDKVRQSSERSREREASKRGEIRRLSPTNGRTRSKERSRKDVKHQRDGSPDRRSKWDKKGLIHN